ncbi:MAG: DNA replication and repair protein RecF [Prosthecobacter sp.]|nr:DNA replication and repair protein RecF [Prosthecobacter sp.]
MNAKHITDITIKNFRGFENLELHGLGAVNLIVGQNNAGKTSLLEAINAAAAPGMISKLPGLFRANAGKVAERYFHWLVSDGAKTCEVSADTDDGKRGIVISKGTLPPRLDDYYRKEQIGPFEIGRWSTGRNMIEVWAVSVQHRSPDGLVPNFANAVRSPQSEGLMEQLLAKVDPRIKTVRLDYADEDPFISVDIGLSERVPLPQAGQGIYRMVAILSDLLGVKPKVCLIDEIENGIHYTALKQVWKGIAEISSTLGIQVFATTHSRECLEAAHEVFFTDDPKGEKDFAVIQLMRVKGQVIGKVLNEARVDAAMENEIELR